MKYEYPIHLSLIDRVKTIDPEIAAYYVLRAHSWPTAVLQRIAYFVEIGADITTLLEHSQGYFTRKPPSKGDMVNFINEQIGDYEKLIQRNAYHEEILPKTGIHIVDLHDPFTWTTKSAYGRQQLICDLASLSRSSGPQTSFAFGELMSAHNNYGSRCIIDLNETVKRLFSVGSTRK